MGIGRLAINPQLFVSMCQRFKCPIPFTMDVMHHHLPDDAEVVGVDCDSPHSNLVLLLKSDSYVDGQIIEPPALRLTTVEPDSDAAAIERAKQLREKKN